MLELKDYQEAIDVQNACNLSGVVGSFSRVLTKLWEVPGAGTEFVNTHPISRLYAEQIAHLSGAGMGDSESYSAAYTITMEVLEGVHPVTIRC